MSRKAHTCVMERLKAFNLQDALDKKEDLPENFNIDDFFSALGKFISAMHEEKGIFHRDLHGGNIMIERETGMPCVIDFGAAKKGSDENTVYLDENTATGESTHFTRDEVKLAEHRQALEKVINNIR